MIDVFFWLLTNNMGRLLRALFNFILATTVFFTILFNGRANAALAGDQCGVTETTLNMTATDYQWPHHRVVGGYESVPHSWPWMGQLMQMISETRGRFICGCVLVSPHYVITAAHCFGKRGQQPKMYRVILGGHELFSGETYVVEMILIHPLYSVYRNSYDVTLLKISPPVPLNESATEPICLPTRPPPLNKVCVVAGWGYQQEKGRAANALREIHVPIGPPAMCHNYGYYFFAPSMICAGFASGMMDSCQGDSGGPLMCQQPTTRDGTARWELQGLVSMGNGCGRRGWPGIYTKVYSVAPWIRMQLKST